MPQFTNQIKVVNGQDAPAAKVYTSAVGLVIGSKPAAFQFMTSSNEVCPLNMPLLCCACANSCNFHKNESPRGKEKILATCNDGACGFRFPGSLHEVLTDAKSSGRFFFKIMFCQISKRPMFSVYKQANQQIVAACGAMNCSCQAVPIQDILACEDDVQLLDDGVLQKARQRGFSMLMEIDDKSCIEKFSEGVHNYNMFLTRSTFGISKPPANTSAPKKSSTKRSGASVDVKTMTKGSKKSSSAKKKIVIVEPSADEELDLNPIEDVSSESEDE